MSAEFINLLEAVNREAETVGSLFRDTLPGRDALWEFLDVNGWFGVEHIEAGRNTLVATLEPMKDALDLWLRAYNRSRSEKIDLMLAAYEHTLPLTCQAFQTFIQNTDGILQTEEYGGFVRFRSVQRLDPETRMEAQSCFYDYQRRGVILNGSFEDTHWRLTNQLHTFTLDFSMDTNLYQKNAEPWVGCTAECYLECMKAFIALQLGKYTLTYLQQVLYVLSLLAGKTAEDAKSFINQGRFPKWRTAFFAGIRKDDFTINIHIRSPT